jgi:hypothetical protein
MIFTKDYSETLHGLGRSYCVEIRFISGLWSWMGRQGISGTEPVCPMKLTAGEGGGVTMQVQSEIDESGLDDLINALGVRWSLKENLSDLSKRLNSVKKRIAFIFLKTYSRNVPDVSGDEWEEDTWAMGEMERLGLFRE